MKQFFILFLLIFSLISVSQSSLKAETAKDFSVMLSAEADPSAPSIKLKWAKLPNAVNFSIFRKSINDANWSILTTVISTDTFYVDGSVSVGNAYEYAVQVKCNSTYKDKPFIYSASGFIYAGLDAPATLTPGRVLILVDSLVVDSLKKELNVFEDDLKKEGWFPWRIVVPRAEKFDKDKVKTVKDIINSEYTKSNKTIKAAILIGRVPVPYSGKINPDGHPDHLGAWPADVYYGITEGIFWSDKTVKDSISASRNENKNVANDGKFDQSSIAGGKVGIMIGRIDFYNMPAFKMTEVQLIKDYLKRNHEYRIGNTAFQWGGFIDDNFPPANFSYQEAFASCGWRNIATLTNPASVFERDFLDTLDKKVYLWAYGTGPGSYTSAGGIGTSSDFTVKPLRALFTALFGSYFGDWDSQNNLLRASLCPPSQALTSCWAARPHWYFHHMGLDEPIGTSLIKSQTNYNTYYPFVWYKINGSDYPNGTIVPIGNQMPHVSLLGDPTLKIIYGFVPEVTELKVENIGFGKQKLSWSSPKIKDLFFNVYRSTDPFGPYTKINTEALKLSEFEDIYSFEGKVYYIVKAMQKLTNNNGTFYKESPPASQSIILTGINEAINQKFNVSIYPNPAQSFINLNLNAPEPDFVNISLYDLEGKLVAKLAETYVNDSDLQLHIPLNYISSTYFIRIKGSKFDKSIKFDIINK